MLNPFPELLAFGLAAPFIIRVCLGAVFVRHGYSKLFKNRKEAAANFQAAGTAAKYLAVTLGIVEFSGGIMLLAGFLTQIAALVLTLATLSAAIFRKVGGDISERDFNFSVFLSLVSVSLLFSGAGFFAFDIPL